MSDRRRLAAAWRLAIGTLTTVPVRAPVEVTPRVAGPAMLLAPVAGLVLGVLSGGVFWVASVLGTGSLVASALAIAALRLGDRGFHLDGLADTADGLAASYDRERALAVMRTGDTGPAGATALVLVLLVQVAAFAGIGHVTGVGDVTAAGLDASVPAAVALVGCVVISRAMLAVGCLRGVPSARPDGLGAAVAGSVRWPATLAMLVMVAAVVAGALGLTDVLIDDGSGTAGSVHVPPWWSGPLAVGAAVAVTAGVLWRCIRRLGGVTGDVLGAVVEVSLAAALVGFLSVT